MAKNPIFGICCAHKNVMIAAYIVLGLAVAGRMAELFAAAAAQWRYQYESVFLFGRENGWAGYTFRRGSPGLCAVEFRGTPGKFAFR
jgi:hypothetical protein